MDAHTESELLKSINASLTTPSHIGDNGEKTPTKTRTSVFIAHRLRTVIEADLIIVMKEGKVVEQGTHEELLKVGGLYWSMWVEQSLGGGGLGGSVEGVDEIAEVMESENATKV